MKREEVNIDELSPMMREYMKTKDKFTTSIHIYIDGSNEKLIDIITAATKVDVNIVSINYKKKTKDGDFYEIICKVKDINTLNLLMVNLQSLKFVNKIERGITK